MKQASLVSCVASSAGSECSVVMAEVISVHIHRLERDGVGGQGGLSSPRQDAE